jgi:hypothetical protein
VNCAVVNAASHASDAPNPSMCWCGLVGSTMTSDDCGVPGVLLPTKASDPASAGPPDPELDPEDVLPELDPEEVLPELDPEDAVPELEPEDALPELEPEDVVPELEPLVDPESEPLLLVVEPELDPVVASRSELVSEPKFASEPKPEPELEAPAPPSFPCVACSDPFEDPHAATRKATRGSANLARSRDRGSAKSTLHSLVFARLIDAFVCVRLMVPIEAKTHESTQP